MSPGELVFDIDDHAVRISMVGGGDRIVPVGPVSLVENELERSDQPTPEQLTNSLGIVTDHLDDVLRESPLVAAASAVAFAGRHSVALAQVELGAHEVPPRFVLQRADADDVFRTLVSESTADRLHNPGLDPSHVHTIIGTCCIVLAVMRRLELSATTIIGGITDTAGTDADTPERGTIEAHSVSTAPPPTAPEGH